MHSIKATEISPDQDESIGLLGFYRPRKINWFADPSIKLPSVTVLLVVTNAMTIAALFFLILSPNQSFDSKDLTTVVYPQQPEWFPPQTSVPVIKVLEGDKLYGQAPNPESIKAWNALLPSTNPYLGGTTEGRGWVTMQNKTALPELPGLNQSLPEHRALPSVYHQLHCLYSTMDAYYGLLNQTCKAEKRELSPKDPGWNSEHLNHCWDYLRQNIMCNADVTLEWYKYNEKVGTGWGYQHQCKDWEAIVAWTEVHRDSNDWGILRGGGERIPLE